MATKTQQHNDSRSVSVRSIARRPYLMSTLGNLIGSFLFVCLINGSVFPPNPVAGFSYAISHGMETMVFMGVLMVTTGLPALIGLYTAAKAR